MSFDGTARQHILQAVTERYSIYETEDLKRTTLNEGNSAFSARSDKRQGAHGMPVRDSVPHSQPAHRILRQGWTGCRFPSSA
jgi:hypothetical protein